MSALGVLKRRICRRVRSTIGGVARAPAEGPSIDDFCGRLRQGDFSRTPCALVIQKGGLAGSDVEVSEVHVEGVVIVTQTCDLVRAVNSDPYVQLAKLFAAPDEDTRRWLASGHVPSVVRLPGSDDLFADLNLIATVEKSSLLSTEWDRHSDSPQDLDDFANAVGRRSSRFAFPDDFQQATKKLRDRIRSKYGKQESAEGRILTKVRQIRATATPNWASDTYAATLTFIVDPTQFPIGAESDLTVNDELQVWTENASVPQLCSAIEDPARSLHRPYLWQSLAEKWADICTPNSSVTVVDAEVATADEFSVADMWMSQRLDMDYLSDDEDVHTPEP